MAFSDLLHTKSIDIIGLPSDLGANRRGSNMGPASLRIAELVPKLKGLGYAVNDLGDIDVPIRDALSAADQEKKRLAPLGRICADLAEVTYNSLSNGHKSLAIGGDHTLAAGSVSGVSRYFRDQGKKLGIIWADAHADMNSPQTSETGNIHGMPLCALLGNGYPELTNIGGDFTKLRPEHTFLIGIRSVDPAEIGNLKESGIRYYTMRDIDERGMPAIMDEVIAVLAKECDGIHVSFDIDGVDPIFAPGVSTPVHGGFNFREAHLLLERTAETGKLCSMDLVELNPYTDHGHQTAEFAVDIALSAFGSSIL